MKQRNLFFYLFFEAKKFNFYYLDVKSKWDNNYFKIQTC